MQTASTASVARAVAPVVLTREGTQNDTGDRADPEPSPDHRPPVTKVSVAMCTFNGAQYLNEQLESIAAQSRPVDELVIADDGSTDSTMELVREFAGSAPFPLVILPPSQRLGVAKNFERAIGACSGEVVLLCDQDDTWRADKVSVLLEALQRTGAWVAHSDATLVDGQGKELGLTAMAALKTTGFERRCLASGRSFPALLRRNLMTGATMAVTREAIDHAMPIPPGWIHDEWIAIMSASTAPTVFVDQQLVEYRQHGSNEIGMARPTLMHRVRRVLQPRGERVVGLAARSNQLVERLESAGAPGVAIKAARAKATFEARRARLPKQRLGRLVVVASLAARGQYGSFASRGWWDVIRDLLQPA